MDKATGQIASFYAGRIRRGQTTLDDVPARWRDAVEAMLAE